MTNDTTPAPAPASANYATLQMRIASMEEGAQLIRAFVERNLKEGIDFGTVKGQTSTGRDYETKPALFKPGAEKLTLAMGLRVRFKPDYDTCTMAGNPAGLMALKCFLIDGNGRVVAEARGAASTGERKGWTVNNAIKVCEKRAHVAAILRVAGLSEHFVTEEEDGDHGARAEKPQERRQASETTNRPAPTARAAAQRQGAPPSPKARVWRAFKELYPDAADETVKGELTDWLRTHIREGATPETATADEWAKAAPLIEEHAAKMKQQRRLPPQPFNGPAPARQAGRSTPTLAEVSSELFS